MSSAILFTTRNNIATLTVNRPSVRNALNWQAQQEFAATVAAVAADPSLRALIITGAGDQAFVAGGDLRELAVKPVRATGVRLHQTMTAALARLTRLPIPVIGAINGQAVGGGCEILTACDLRIAAPHAELIFGQIRVGLSTGWGGGYRLVHLLGRSVALELLLTGRTLTATEAQTIGLVHRLSCPDADLLTAAQAWAEELTALPAAALAGIKQMAMGVSQLTPTEAHQQEREIFLNLFSAPDNQEALAAFLEGRKPHFNQTGGGA